MRATGVEAPDRPTPAAMLEPSEVIYDGRWARVGRVRDESGRAYIRKVGTYLLTAEGTTLVECLHELTAQPHPNLLVPERFAGGNGEPLSRTIPI